jgi:hypothetical protein
VETFRVFPRELRLGALDSSIESAGKRVRDVVVIRNQARVWVEIGYQPENASNHSRQHRASTTLRIPLDMFRRHRYPHIGFVSALI